MQRQAIAREVRSAELDADLTLRRALADPNVVRISQLLGAATDLVSEASASQPITGMSRSLDREAWLASVGEMTGQIARVTRESLERARDVMPLAMNSMTRLWEVERHSRAFTAGAMPGARDSVLHDAGAALPRLDGDVREVLGAWVTQATWTLNRDNPTPDGTVELLVEVPGLFQRGKPDAGDLFDDQAERGAGDVPQHLQPFVRSVIAGPERSITTELLAMEPAARTGDMVLTCLDGPRLRVLIAVDAPTHTGPFPFTVRPPS